MALPTSQSETDPGKSLYDEKTTSSHFNCANVRHVPHERLSVKRANVKYKLASNIGASGSSPAQRCSAEGQRRGT